MPKPPPTPRTQIRGKQRNTVFSTPPVTVNLLTSRYVLFKEAELSMSNTDKVVWLWHALTITHTPEDSTKDSTEVDTRDGKWRPIGRAQDGHDRVNSSSTIAQKAFKNGSRVTWNSDSAKPKKPWQVVHHQDFTCVPTHTETTPGCLVNDYTPCKLYFECGNRAIDDTTAICQFHNEWIISLVESDFEGFCVVKGSKSPLPLRVGIVNSTGEVSATGPICYEYSHISSMAKDIDDGNFLLEWATFECIKKVLRRHYRGEVPTGRTVHEWDQKLRDIGFNKEEDLVVT
ncbi:hypothetical protein OPT61_g9688 [Boeremia exigua]|uniref:Uncharacterized protein n=1 Tax=Boeremia exigua TaxID=749465 RepID=A0ACC2HT03_9PLEO|nr:hypothetical protein OPT61_g9688 [Boeremia exigua]